MRSHVHRAFSVLYQATLFVCWFYGSAVFLRLGHEDMFARMGAVGVAVVVLVYGLLHLRSSRAVSEVSKMYEKILIDFDSDLSKRLDAVLRLVEISIKLTRVESSNEVDGKITEVLKRSKLLSEEIVTDNKKFLVDVSALRNEAELLHFGVSIAQILFVVVATLQWGFGDLLVAYIHSN